MDLFTFASAYETGKDLLKSHEDSLPSQYLLLEDIVTSHVNGILETMSKWNEEFDQSKRKDIQEEGTHLKGQLIQHLINALHDGMRMDKVFIETDTQPGWITQKNGKRKSVTDTWNRGEVTLKNGVVVKVPWTMHVDPEMRKIQSFQWNPEYDEIVNGLQIDTKNELENIVNYGGVMALNNHYHILQYAYHRTSSKVRKKHIAEIMDIIVQQVRQFQDNH